MAKKYAVKITHQAQAQMQEITHYITYELKSLNAALSLLDELEEAIISLAQFPQRVPLVKEEPWRSAGIHRLPVKNFLVYFWVDEKNIKVQVTAVIYAKRDQIWQLSQMDIENK